MHRQPRAIALFLYITFSNCQTKYPLGIKLGGFINYPKAYMRGKISLPAPSESFGWALFMKMHH